MSSSPLVYIQVSILITGISLNGFGIHCLKQQKSGNTNSWILLQNLALVEIVKAVYDFAALAAYHYYIDWYKAHLICFTIMEVSLMTIFFISVMFISLDKILVLLLHGKYAHRVTRKLVKWSIRGAWLFGLVMGAFLRGKNKLFWYLASEGMVLVLNFAAMFFYRRWMRERDGRFPQISTKRCRTISLLLLTSFTVLYFLPDCVFISWPSRKVFKFVQFFWTTGYIADPLIYTFSFTKVKNTAMVSLGIATKAAATRGTIVMKHLNTSGKEKLKAKLSDNDTIAVKEILKEKVSGEHEPIDDDDDILGEESDHFIINMLGYEQVDDLADIRALARRQTIAFGQSTAIKLDTAAFRRLVSKPGA